MATHQDEEPAVTPLYDPYERRAFCLKMAIDTKAWFFSKDDRTSDSGAAAVVSAATIYEQWIMEGHPLDG